MADPRDVLKHETEHLKRAEAEGWIDPSTSGHFREVLHALSSALARIEALEPSWLELLRLIAKKLDGETDWDGADDNTFLDDFDPWVLLRALPDAALAAVRETGKPEGSGNGE